MCISGKLNYKISFLVHFSIKSIENDNYILNLNFFIKTEYNPCKSKWCLGIITIYRYSNDAVGLQI